MYYDKFRPKKLKLDPLHNSLRLWSKKNYKGPKGFNHEI